MDISYLNELISPVALDIALVIGFLIKHAIENTRINHFISIICALVGLIVVLCVDIMAGNFIVAPILQGLILGLAATGLFEAFQNMFMLSDISKEDN